MVDETLYFIVCGSRHGINGGAPELDFALDLAFPVATRERIHVLSGSYEPPHCVDRRAFDWAMKREVPATIIPARWETGTRRRGEGPLRNRRMLRIFPSPITAVLAFRGGDGTADMCRAAKHAEIPV